LNPISSVSVDGSLVHLAILIVVNNSNSKLHTTDSSYEGERKKNPSAMSNCPWQMFFKKWGEVPREKYDLLGNRGDAGTGV